jgi:hypothetical protein
MKDDVKKVADLLVDSMEGRGGWEGPVLAWKLGWTILM